MNVLMNFYQVCYVYSSFDDKISQGSVLEIFREKKTLKDIEFFIGQEVFFSNKCWEIRI